MRCTWAPRGQTPVLRPKQRNWKKVSATGAIAYHVDGNARVFLRFRRGDIHAPDVVTFLRHLRRHLRGPILIVWDGLRAHRSKLVQEWLDRNPTIQVHRLPAYAPELNPVECLWGWIKGTLLANVCEDSLDPIVERVRRGTRGLRRRRRYLLWAFLQGAGLSW